MDDKLAEAVETVKKATGYFDDESEPVFELDGISYGARVRVIEDDEDEGAFEGDEGYAVPCMVGAVEHGNLHAKMYFLADGTDSAIAVSADNLEPA